MYSFQYLNFKITGCICVSKNNFLILGVDSANLKINTMKNTLLAVLFNATLFVFAGCAPVQFYSNNGLTQKTGLKYYTTKPFLHVERDPETNRVVKATIIYLPDLANPQYMVIRDGVNSRKINLKFKDGCITDFGYSTTGKVSESVDALATLISKGTDALTEINTLKGMQALKAASNSAELYEIIFGPEKTSLRQVTVDK